MSLDDAISRLTRERARNDSKDAFLSFCGSNGVTFRHNRPTPFMPALPAGFAGLWTEYLSHRPQPEFLTWAVQLGPTLVGVKLPHPSYEDRWPSFSESPNRPVPTTYESWLVKKRRENAYARKVALNRQNRLSERQAAITAFGSISAHGPTDGFSFVTERTDHGSVFDFLVVTSNGEWFTDSGLPWPWLNEADFADILARTLAAPGPTEVLR